MLPHRIVALLWLAASVAGQTIFHPPGGSTASNSCTDCARKSTTFTTGRAAKINAQGKIESVAGTATDCVKVDGSSGACATGSGSGDVVGPSASVDSEIALFNSTTGKLLKRASSTGVVKLTGGVLGTVSGTATDCVLVNGTSGTCGGSGSLPSGSGVVKVTSGVGALVTGAVDDCVKVNGSSGACGGAGSLPSVTGQTNMVLSNDGTNALWRALGGDVSGSPQNASVTRVRGVLVDTTTPTEGQALVYDTANLRYSPRGIVHTLQASTGLICSTSAGQATCRTDDAVVPFYISGSGAPAYNCQAGRDFYTDSTAGTLYFCRASNTWQALGAGGGGGSSGWRCAATSSSTRTTTGAFGASCTVPANTLAVGSIVTVDACGTHTTAGGGMYYSLAVGATQFTAAGPYVTAASAVGWCLRASGVVRTLGASGSLWIAGTSVIESSNGTSTLYNLKTTTAWTIDTTGTIAIAPYVAIAASGSSSVDVFSVSVQ